MTYKMTPKYQKVLTELIGEKWINIDYSEQYPLSNKMNRTFTTDPDMMKAFRCLVDNGKWVDFLDWVYCERYEQHIEKLFENICLFHAWLKYDAERFCCLVAQAKEEVVI